MIRKYHVENLWQAIWKILGLSNAFINSNAKFEQKKLKQPQYQNLKVS